MTNPFDLAYLTTAEPALGPFAVAFLVVQLLAVLAGLYLAFVRRERDAARQALAKRAGALLLVFGVAGLALGWLRFNSVWLFAQRYWFYLLFAIELVAVAALAYTARTVGAGQKQSVSRASKPRQGERQPARRASPAASSADRTRSNGSAGHTDEEEEAAVTRSSRRSARRSRKRKR